MSGLLFIGMSVTRYVYSFNLYGFNTSYFTDSLFHKKKINVFYYIQKLTEVHTIVIKKYFRLLFCFYIRFL